MVKLRLGGPVGLKFLSPATAFLDNESVREVGHELEVFLLLLHFHDLQLFAKEGFKLLLKAECESQPSHVTRISALKSTLKLYNLKKMNY